MISGRDAPLDDASHVGLDSGFIIPSSAESRDVYLRITTTTSLTADVTVRPVAEATNRANAFSGFLAVYVCFILGFCLWGLVAWGIQRDLLYGLFFLRQLYSLAHAFIHFGSFRYFLSGSISAETRDIIHTFITATASVAVYFDVRLISEFGPARWIKWLCHAILCLPAISVAFLVSGQPPSALKCSAFIVTFQMMALVVLALTTRHRPERPLDRQAVWLLRAAYLAVAPVIVAPLLMYTNVLHTSVPLFKIMFLHAVISTVILFAVLSIRSRQRDLTAQEARLLVEVKESELRKESSRRMEKERFLSMLTHELRNPLAVIELLPGTDPSSAATVRKAARDMAEVIDRVEQSERIDNGQMQVDMDQRVPPTQRCRAGRRLIPASRPTEGKLAATGSAWRRPLAVGLAVGG